MAAHSTQREERLRTIRRFTSVILAAAVSLADGTSIARRFLSTKYLDQRVPSEDMPQEIMDNFAAHARHDPEEMLSKKNVWPLHGLFQPQVQSISSLDPCRYFKPLGVTNAVFYELSNAQAAQQEPSCAACCLPMRWSSLPLCLVIATSCWSII